MDDLLLIGRFARLTGLSVGALRHYDELDLLRPANVDRETGYRSYRPEQVGRARTIARLRDLEMSLDEIRQVLDADDPAMQRQILARNRARLEARMSRIVYVLHVLRELAEDKESLVPETAAPTVTADLDDAARRRLAVDLFNHVWRLIETANRTPEQTDEMIHAAHASRYHWGEIGEPAHLARGEWQCSRVYAILGRSEPALWHARRCLDICEQHGLADWDIAAADEAMARASAVAGDQQATKEWKAKAQAACSAIAEDDDREIIEQDLLTIP